MQRHINLRTRKFVCDKVFFPLSLSLSPRSSSYALFHLSVAPTTLYSVFLRSTVVRVNAHTKRVRENETKTRTHMHSHTPTSKLNSSNETNLLVETFFYMERRKKGNNSAKLEKNLHENVSNNRSTPHKNLIKLNS